MGLSDAVHGTAVITFIHFSKRLAVTFTRFGTAIPRIIRLSLA